MAKKLDKWESRHKQRLSLYQRRVDALYKKACRELSRITANLRDYNPEDAFSFKNRPSIQQGVESVLNGLKSGITTIIVDGVNSEWTLANDKNNELSRQVFGDNVGKLSQEQYRRYFSDNDEARKAFLARKENGLSLSDRVWNYTNQFKNEIELGLDIGLRNGLSADEMTRELKQYLKYPDKLFRRVRDERGVLQLSKAAADFHPGRGVYRSSYKNALRLAVTETNMAYRTADHDRIQTMDFVVGIRVVLSNNHTVNGMPLYDICDELSAPLGSTATKGRGCYPKDFKFTGWHPNCRCHVEFIQLTQEEMDRMTQDTLDGKPWSGNSVNEVKDVPLAYKEWCEQHANEIIQGADRNKLPYFVRDNLDVSMTAAKRGFVEYASVTRADLDFLSRQGIIGDTPEWETWKQQASKILSTYSGKEAQEFLSRQGWSDSVAHSVFDYVKTYQDRIPQAKYMLEDIARLKGHDEIARIKKINALKHLCAAECQKDLAKWGAVDGLEFVRVEKNYSAMKAQTLTTKGGINVNISDLKLDIVTYRDKWGKTYSYPIGVKEDELIFKAGQASKVLRTLPPYLRGQVKNLYFFQRDCPMNPYWELEYLMPNFKAQATDGTKTTWWIKPDTAGRFHKVMCHESAHVFDNAHSVTTSRLWLEAIDKDFAALSELPQILRYPTSYAERSPVEDFAESIAVYIKNPAEFRKVFKYRAQVIEALIKKHPKG